MDDDRIAANRMELVSRWAEDLAHEIKNPLHAMVINLELVKRRAAAGEADPAIERAELVESELQRVHALVNAMLRLVRPWPDSATTDVDALFDDVLPALRARARVRQLDYRHTPGADWVTLPPGDLALVLLNLVDAAIDVAAPDGRVSTTCETGEDVVRIVVRGSGPVPDGDTGPRLATASRIVQKVGGTLVVEHDSGRGEMAATVVLPRTGAA